MISFRTGLPVEAVLPELEQTLHVKIVTVSDGADLVKKVFEEIV